MEGRCFTYRSRVKVGGWWSKKGPKADQGSHVAALAPDRWNKCSVDRRGFSRLPPATPTPYCACADGWGDSAQVGTEGEGTVLPPSRHRKSAPSGPEQGLPRPSLEASLAQESMQWLPEVRLHSPGLSVPPLQLDEGEEDRVSMEDPSSSGFPGLRQTVSPRGPVPLRSLMSGPHPSSQHFQAPSQRFQKG